MERMHYTLKALWILIAACILAALIVAPAAAAPLGSSFRISPNNGAWFPEAAYNSSDQKYLVVYTDYSQSPIRATGQFVTSDGATTGSAFGISNPSYFGMYPQVAYNSINNQFMVTWIDGRSDRIYGRIIAGSDGSWVGSDFEVSSVARSTSAIAWSSASNTYLVAMGNLQVYVRLFSNAGAPLTSLFNVCPNPGYSGYPWVCYSASGDQFLVTWDQEDLSDIGQISGQRVSAVDGALLGGRINVTPTPARNRSIATYDSVNGRWLVQFNDGSHPGMSYDQYGQFVNPDGSLAGSNIPIAAHSYFEGNTLIHCAVAYAPLARRYLSNFAMNDAGAQELDENGTLVGGQWNLSNITAGMETFSNAVVADTHRSRFLCIWESFDGTNKHLRGRIFAATIHPVTGLTVTPGGTNNSLSWTNPTDPHYTGTKVLFRTDRYPASAADGTQVYDGIGASCIHSSLTSGVTYYYAVYAHSVAPDYSDPSLISARPDGIASTPIVTSPASGSLVTTITPTIQWFPETHDAYQVRISQMNDPNTSVNGWDSGIVSSASNSATSGALRDMSIYYVFARLHSASGWGNWSATGYTFTTRTTTDCVFYPADALPSGSGWTLYDSGVESGPGMSSSIVVDGGSNVFKIIDSSTGRHCKARYSVSNVSFDTGASVAVRMKATGTIVNPGPNAGISNGGVGGMYLSLTTTAIRLVENTGTVRGSYSLTGTAYHKYQLTVQNATIGSNSTALWKVYVDGIPRISWTGVGTDDGFDGYMIGAGPLTATGTWWIDWAAGRADGAYAPSQWDPISPELTYVSAPVVTDDGAYTGSLTKLYCSWSPVPGASQYRYRIGTTSGGAEILGWTTVGSALEVTNTGLTLTEGSTYYFSVQADNGFGTWSESGISNGIAVPAGVSVQAAKALANTEVRAIRGKTVTAAFTGYFYIQESLLPYGIKVLSNTAVTAGQTVNVAGTMSGEGGERAIDATSAKIETSAGTAIPAISMSNLALGGADLNTLALGVVDGVGANNPGLLVRCWGKVSNIVGTAYQISDGSLLSGGSPVMVTVQAPDLASVPEDSEFVVVEGISSMDGSRQRVLLVPAP